MRKTVAAALLVAAGSSSAGQPMQTIWEIPYPPGARMEVQGRAEMGVRKINGHELRLEVAPEHHQAKAKARWAWGNRVCYSDGALAQVLSNIDSCATRAVSTK